MTIALFSTSLKRDAGSGDSKLYSSDRRFETLYKYTEVPQVYIYICAEALPVVLPRPPIYIFYLPMAACRGNAAIE